MFQKYFGFFLGAILAGVLFPTMLNAGSTGTSETYTLAVIGQSCASGGNYTHVTFQIQGGCPIWDHDLYIDGGNYSGIDSCGSPKTVTLNHNTHYGAYGYSYSMASTPYIYFNTYYCPAPPTLTVYRHTDDGVGWSPYDTWMAWNSHLYIYWSATNANYCYLHWSGAYPAPGEVDYYPPYPGYGGALTYGVTCYGPGGSDYDSIYVARYAPPAPYVMLYHSINGAGWSQYDATMPWNGSLAIHTSTANVSSCSGNYHNAGLSVDYNPTLPGYGSGMYYSVTCYGPGGSASDSVWISRQAPPVAPNSTVSANPSTILVGASTLVTYGNTTGSATSCLLEASQPGQSNSPTIHSSSGGLTSTSRTLSIPGSWRFYAQCTGPGGSSSWNTFDVQVNYPNPSANLQVRRVASSTWSDSLTINPGEQIELGWNQTGSANTTSCAAVPPLYGFATGNAISGIDNSIDEPIGNSSYTYRLLCYGQGSPATQAADTLTVTTNGGVGAMFCPGTEVSLVSKGSSVDLCWQLGTNDPAMCSISAGSNPLLSSLSSKNGTYTYPSIVGEVTFTLNCQGGDSDTMTVKVLPELQET